MATTTDRFKWPIPTGLDRVRDGDNQMAALGRAIDQQTFGGNEWIRTVRTASTSMGSGGSWVNLLMTTVEAQSATLDALSADSASPLVANGKPGLYLVGAMITWSSGTTGRRLFRLNSIGVEVARDEISPVNSLLTQSACWLHYQGGPGGRLQLQAFTDVAGLSITSVTMTVARLASSA